MDLNKMRVYLKDTVAVEFQHFVGKPCKVVRLSAGEPRYQIESPEGKRTWVYTSEIEKIETESLHNFTVVKVIASVGLSDEDQTFDTAEQAVNRANELNAESKAWCGYTWVVIVSEKDEKEE